MKHDSNRLARGTLREKRDRRPRRSHRRPSLDERNQFNQGQAGPERLARIMEEAK